MITYELRFTLVIDKIHSIGRYVDGLDVQTLEVVRDHQYTLVAFREMYHDAVELDHCVSQARCRIVPDVQSRRGVPEAGEGKHCHLADHLHPYSVPIREVSL